MLSSFNEFQTREKFSQKRYMEIHIVGRMNIARFWTPFSGPQTPGLL